MPVAQVSTHHVHGCLEVLLGLAELALVLLDEPKVHHAADRLAVFVAELDSQGTQYLREPGVRIGELALRGLDNPEVVLRLERFQVVRAERLPLEPSTSRIWEPASGKLFHSSYRYARLLMSASVERSLPPQCREPSIAFR